MWRSRRERNDPPPLEESSVWSSKPAPASAPSDDPSLLPLADALARVLAEGGLFLRCSACGSRTTNLEGREYQRHVATGATEVQVVRTCANCSNVDAGTVSAAEFVCIKARQTWDQSRVAVNLFDSEMDLLSDLDELDS